MVDAASKLRLQWRDHGNELSKLSREVFGNDDFTDVTLTCLGGSPYHAHKMVLAAASTYFRNFFKEVQCKIQQHLVIFMKDMAPAEMEYLLQFIYLGEVDIPSTDLERLITISRELGIVGLNAVKSEAEEAEGRRTPKAAKRKFAPTKKQPQIEQQLQEAPILKKSKVMRDSEPIYKYVEEDQEDEVSQDLNMDDHGNDEDNEAEEDGNVEDAEIMDSYHEEAVDDVSSYNRGMIKKIRKRKKENLIDYPLIGSVAQTMKGNRRGKSTLYIIGDYLYFNGTLQPNNILRAKCRKFRTGSISCKACAYIEPVTLQVLKLTGKHSCTKDPDMKHQIQMETEMKELAETTRDSFKAIYKRVSLKNPAIARRIPYERICKAMIRRRGEMKRNYDVSWERCMV